MDESFEAARDRIVATMSMAQEDLLGFECDLEHGLERSEVLASWKIVRTGDPQRTFLVHARASSGDSDQVERALWTAYERHVRYEGDDLRATNREERRIVLNFATRAFQIASLAVSGEITVELP